MVNRKFFFDYVRTHVFAGKMTNAQVQGMEFILGHWDGSGWPDTRFLAYMLATTYWETNTHMQPVIETRSRNETKNPSVDEAIRRLEASWKAGKMPWVKSPYWRKNAAGLSHLGRGFAQITHESNYAQFKSLTGIDFVRFPDLALEPTNAIIILFIGMSRGLFTGKKLGDYFNGTVEKWVGARRIINGTDHAQEIAVIAKHFYAAINVIPA